MLNYHEGEDEENPVAPDPESQGGPAAGSYGSEDPNMPIPGEEGVDNSRQ